MTNDRMSGPMCIERRYLHLVPLFFSVGSVNFQFMALFVAAEQLSKQEAQACHLANLKGLHVF